MSTTIDQQVVEMRFDNRKFEQNVSTTMSTLDKLKQKLQLSNATKGFENIDSAAKRVDMGSLGNSVETVRAKFSALEVMGVTALANITNSAVETGKRLASSLTIDQITAGWSKYEQKTASIQTIVNATGKSVDEVNSYLNKLMWFSDETSYGFTDMTAALATMTSSGGNIDKLIPMIMGVANATAFAGKGAAEFSRVMQYGINQAYSLGYMQVQDWKTIEGATIGSKQLKEMLIEAGEELGNIEKGAVDIENFRNSLADKWLDTAVMEKAFGRFAEMSEKAYQMVQAGEVETASEAYEILSEKYDGVSITAAKAAQEAKTFTEAIDATKDAVSSGWMKSFETIFGNYEEAKVTWTRLANELWEIFAGGADGRNEFLGEVFNSPWAKLTTQINEAGIETEEFEKAVEKLLGEDKVKELLEGEEFDSLADAIKGGAVATDILQKAFDDLFGSKTAGGVNTLVEGLKEIKRFLGDGSTGEDVKRLQEALDALGYDLGEPGVDGIIGPITEAAIKAFQKDHGLEVDGIIGPNTLAALEEASGKVGLLEGDVDSLRESCKKLIDEVSKKGGRELLIESLFNIIKAIRKPLAAVKKAFSGIFEIKPDNLYNLIDGFHSLTEKIIINDETAEKLTRTFQGIFSLFKLVSTIAGGAFKTAFKVLTVILDKFDIGFLDLTANIGDALTEMSKFVDEALTNGIGAVIDWLLPKITEAIEAVKGWFQSFKENAIGKKVVEVFENWPETLDKIATAFSDGIKAIGDWLSEIKDAQIVKDVSAWFQDASEKISGAIGDIKTSISNFNVGGFGVSDFTGALSGIGTFFTSLWETVKNSKVGSVAIEGIKTAFNNVKEFFGKFKLPEFNLDNLKTWVTDFVKIEEQTEKLGGSGLGAGISGLFGHLKDNVISWNWTVFKESALEKFVNFYLTIGDKVKAAFDKLGEIWKSIKEFIFGTEEVNLPVIMDSVKKVLEIVLLISAISALKKIVSPLDNITSALDNLASSMKWGAIKDMFWAMAGALGVFTICLVILAQVPAEDAKRSAIILGSLMAVLAGIVVAIALFASRISGGLDMAGAVASLLMLVGSIVVLIYALKEIDKLELKDPGKTFLILGGILLALTAGVKMISKAGGSSFRSVAAILTLMAALKLVLEVIKDYDDEDWPALTEGINRMLQMLLALSVAIRIASGGVKAGASASGLALTLIAMVISLKLLIDAIKDYAALPDDVLKRGGAVVGAILGAMTIMLAVANLTSKGATVLQKGEKAVNPFAGFAIALLAIVAAVWLFAKMPEDVLKKGGLAVVAALTALTIVLAVVGKSCSGLKVGPIIAMLAGFAILMVGMMHIIKQMQGMDNMGGVTILLVAMAAVLGYMISVITGFDSRKLTWKKMAKIAAMFAGMLLVLAGIGLVLAMMSGLNTSGAIANATALGILLIVLAGVMGYMIPVMTGFDSRKLTYQKMAKIAVVFAGLLLVLAGLGLVLAMMSSLGVTNAISNAMALSLLLGVLTGAMAVCVAMGTVATGAMAGMWTCYGAIAALSGLVAVIGAMLVGLRHIGFSSDMIGDVLVLSTMLVVLTGVMAVCAAMGTVAAAAIPGLWACYGAMAALTGLVLVIGGVLWLLKGAGIGDMIGDVLVLSTMLVVLTGVMAVCAALGGVAMASGGGILLAVGAIAILVLVVDMIGQVLTKIRDAGIGDMMDDVLVLSAMLGALTIVMGACTLIGFAALAAVAGCAALLLFTGALLELIVEIGKIMSDPALVTFLDTGIDILCKLSEGLGTVISKFGEGLVSGLPEIGEKLSSFADNLELFLTTMGSIDDNLFANIRTLVDAIALLTASDFLGNVNDFFSWGDDESSLGKFGRELSDFGKNAGTFIDAMANLKPETATNMTAFGDLVDSLSAFCGNKDISNGDLTTFGTSLTDFATGLKKAAADLSSITDDEVAAIKRSAEAAMALVDLNKAIPTDGGLIDAIVGSDDIALWGTKISAFADSLVAYSNKVSGNKIDSAAIKASTDAATHITDLNNAIPKEGGVWQAIAGSTDLASWGTKIVSFANSLLSYSNVITGGNIDTAAIQASATAAQSLTDVNNAIPTSGGLWDLIAGSKDLSTFGTGIVDLAKGLVNYSNAAVQIDDTKIAAIEKSKAAIEALKLVAEAIPATESDIGRFFFGGKDLSGFGTGIYDLARGILKYCNVAVQITPDDVTAITNSKTAIDAIKTVLNTLNGWTDSGGTNNFSTAVTRLNDACASVNAITAAGYDYSCIETVKTSVIAKLKEMLSDSEGFTTLSTNATSLQTTIQTVSSCASSIASLNNTTYGGVDTFKAALTSLSEADVDAVVSAFKGKDSELSTSISGMVTAITTGITDMSSKVTSAMENVVTDAANAAQSDVSKTKAKIAGALLAHAFAEGLKDKPEDISSAGETLGKKASEGAKEKYSSMKTAGKHLGNGLVAGIEDKWDDAYDAGYTLGQKAVQGEKDGQASNSPSKLTMLAGKWLGQGLIIGMENMSDKVYDAGSGLGKTATDTISSTISRIASAVNTDIDAQPTIRPVLDLSDVRSGVSTMSGLLNMDSAIGVNANLGAISTMMNRQSQNGRNGEVVSAINKLRDDLGKTGNTTYTISGITYSEGSDVAEAMKTIVRKARIERRV